MEKPPKLRLYLGSAVRLLGTENFLDSLAVDAVGGVTPSDANQADHW